MPGVQRALTPGSSWEQEDPSLIDGRRDHGKRVAWARGRRRGGGRRRTVCPLAGQGREPPVSGPEMALSSAT